MSEQEKLLHDRIDLLQKRIDFLESLVMAKIHQPVVQPVAYPPPPPWYPPTWSVTDARQA